MFGLPFDGTCTVRLVLPSDVTSLSPVETSQIQGLAKLFREQSGALSREIGAPFEVTDESDPLKPRWFVGPYHCNPAIAAAGRSPPTGPEIYLDRKSGLLITDGRNYGEVEETFSYLRSLAHFRGGVLKVEDCTSIANAIQRIASEIRCTYPAFGLRKLDWEALCAEFEPRIERAVDPIPAMQEWLAQLGDGHTWVRPMPALGELSYELLVENGKAYFTNIAEDSIAWSLGVRRGWELVGEDIEGWWRRTAGTEHCKPWIVGRRLLSGKVGNQRSLCAQGPDGMSVKWTEAVPEKSWEPVFECRRLPSGNGYMKIRAWLLGKDLDQSIDKALNELKDAPALIVDLRGNPGGNLVLAQSFRNRFLRKSGPVGWIQATLPDGELGPREEIRGEPAPDAKRWTKPVRFLTDAMTYSASEDALLGLQGLEHVTVIGQPSGGGSGRVRLVRLLPGWRLTISTALTYTLSGHCIEGSGIPVDIQVPLHPFAAGDPVLAAADFTDRIGS